MPRHKVRCLSANKITKDTWNEAVTNVRCLALLSSLDPQVMSNRILTPISMSQPLIITSCPNILPTQIIHVLLPFVPYGGLMSICFGDLCAQHLSKTEHSVFSICLSAKFIVIF